MNTTQRISSTGGTVEFRVPKSLWVLHRTTRMQDSQPVELAPSAPSVSVPVGVIRAKQKFHAGKQNETADGRQALLLAFLAGPQETLHRTWTRTYAYSQLGLKRKENQWLREYCTSAVHDVTCTRIPRCVQVSGRIRDALGGTDQQAVCLRVPSRKRLTGQRQRDGPGKNRAIGDRFWTEVGRDWTKSRVSSISSTVLDSDLALGRIIFVLLAAPP